MSRLLAALVPLLVAVLAVPLVAIGVAFGGALGQLVSQEPPSAYATSVLPAVTIRAFEEAAEQCIGVPWQVLAAVNLTVDPSVMSDLDATTGMISPPFYDASSSDSSETLGPMGFSPAIWSEYEELYDGAPDDALPNPQNEYDAIFTLGRVLCALQVSAGDIDDALQSYDASPVSDSTVLALAVEYGMNVDGTTTDISGSASHHLEARHRRRDPAVTPFRFRPVSPSTDRVRRSSPQQRPSSACPTSGAASLPTLVSTVRASSSLRWRTSA